MPDDPDVIDLKTHQRRVSGAPIFNPGAPYETALALVRDRYTSPDGIRLLHHHDGKWWQWAGTHYVETDTADIRTMLYRVLRDALAPKVRRKKDGSETAGNMPFNPTPRKVGDVLDAMRAAANLPSTIKAPVWIETIVDYPAAGDLLPVVNGFLHVRDRVLYPAAPELFVQHALPYAFEPDAPPPAQFLRVLDEQWGGDREAVETLQEMMGYLLMGSTALQKIFLIVGPKRSGKGTLARVITNLIGRENVVDPTLASLATNFGLAPLIGKQLAIISDARLGSRADQHAIAERLLSVSGEDGVTIDRKYAAAWTGRLPTRFIVMTNELPRLQDTSGALASRFIVLTMRRSFYGREDSMLTAKLLPELPGILNWSLDGLERLRERGHFVQPRSSEEAVQQLEDLGSPMSAFLRDRCIVGAAEETTPAALYDAWCGWNKANGRDHPGTLQTFCRDLAAAAPTITTRQIRHADGRQRVYQGIGMQWGT